MKEITITEKDNLVGIINNILTSDSKDIKLIIDEKSIIFSNFLNLKILVKVIKQSGIRVEYQTSSKKGNEMLSKLQKDESEDISFSKYKEKEAEDLIEEDLKEKSIPVEESKKPLINFDLEKFKNMNIDFKKFTLIPVIVLTVLTVGAITFFLFANNSRAKVELLVDSERFVKSIEVKLSTDKNTDISNKILRVSGVSKNYSFSKEIDTTGKLDAGEKSKGELKILNASQDDIKLKSGTKLVYETKDKKLQNYFTTKEVIVPASKKVSTAPDASIASGEIIVEAQAEGFGSSFDLKAGEAMDVNGYKKELTAIVSSSFEGGNKKTLSAVTSEDIKNVSQMALNEFKDTFKAEVTDSKTYLKNSEIFSIASQSFNAKISDPVAKIKVSQEITVNYFNYDKDEAVSFVKGSIKDLLTDGYELYGKDLDIEINILGNTDKTVLNSKEADAQLTVRSYKIPVLDEQKIKKEITGKSLSEVSKYLGDLNVNYNIEINPLFQLLNSFPSDVSKIDLVISRE